MQCAHVGVGGVRWSGEGVAVEFRDAIIVTKILVLEKHRGAGLVGG